MELEAKVYKDGKFWLVEIPGLDAMTQGRTRKEALAMAKDLILGMAATYFQDEAGADFNVTIADYKKDLIGISANDTKLLLALSTMRLLHKFKKNDGNDTTIKTMKREKNP